MKSEYAQFNTAMDTILKADPKRAKEQMEEEVRERAEARKAKRASEAHAEDGKD